MTEMVSSLKVAWHRVRLEAYLRGEPIFPVTLELNLTARCNRTCPDCPSSLGDSSMSLDLAFTERLLSALKGRTKGLILTGGEPTLSPVFPEVLRLAREAYGFEEIAVITNGSLLGDTKVASALVSYGSAVRVSLYDWYESSLKGLKPTLGSILALRKSIEDAGSELEIGVSVLTSSRNAKLLGELAGMSRSAGAHWIYFHPTCIKEISGAGSRREQQAVLEGARRLKSTAKQGFDVYFIDGRYQSDEVEFEGYHAAHFVLVIGADGKNYLASEVKYQPDYMIFDLLSGWRDDFLWQGPRLRRIARVSSNNYPAKGSRNRGVLYNTFIEKLKRDPRRLADKSYQIPVKGFRLPHIL